MDFSACQRVLICQLLLMAFFHDQQKVGFRTHPTGQLLGAVSGYVQAVLSGDSLRKRIGWLAHQRREPCRPDILVGELRLQQGFRNRTAANIADADEENVIHESAFTL
jgi:hypothetical protein